MFFLTYLKGFLEMKQIHYKEKIENFTSKLDTINKKISKLSIVRLMIVVIGIVVIYQGFALSPSVGYIILLIVILLFLFVVKKHNKLYQLREWNKNMIAIYSNEISESNSSNLFGDGEIYKNPLHEYSSDLDIFGKYSLFNIVNRTVTVQGENTLSTWLLSTSHKKETILNRQQVIKELEGKVEFKDKFLATFFISDKFNEDIDGIGKWVSAFKYFFIEKKYLQIVLYILSFLTIVTSLVGFVNPIFWKFSILFIMINYFITMKFTKQVNLIHEHISKQEKLFLKYSSLVKIIKEENFESPYLQQIQNKLTDENQIEQELKSLSRLIKALDYRLNLVMAAILNIFLLWDIQYAFKVEAWMKKNSPHINGWLDNIGDIDAHLSLSILYFNNPDWVFPSINEDKFIIKGTNIGHPLINKKDRIDNDYSIDGKGKFDIVTGSNMAGKSTFLRTLGLNSILALNGCPVCADSFEVSNIRLITYMRIIDSLEDNLSTFHAELERIKSILKYVETNDNCFLLLDELLRGTNSQDRHIGTKALIKQMMRNTASGIIATHDLALTEMINEFSDSIRNYNFGVKTKDNELYFDYKLTNGICDSFNASILMKKIGIDIDL